MSGHRLLQVILGLILKIKLDFYKADLNGRHVPRLHT